MYEVKNSLLGQTAGYFTNLDEAHARCRQLNEAYHSFGVYGVYPVYDARNYSIIHYCDGRSEITDGENTVIRPFSTSHMVTDEQMRAELQRMHENKKGA